MKYLTLACLLLLSCREKNVNAIQDIPVRHQVLISSGQFATCEIIKIDSIAFDLAVNEASDTIYLATQDSTFRTPEGLGVGMRFGQIPNDLKAHVIKEAGWGYYVPLDSKWNLGFCEGSSCTDSDPTDSSGIKWVFKRK